MSRVFLSENTFRIYSTGLLGLCLLILVLASMQVTDGQLIYTLDDPYIHLAVAENIIKGGYGVNLSEYSSPSSSILYPFLLAFTEVIGLGIFGPLIYAASASLLSTWILSGMLWKSVGNSFGRLTSFVFCILGPLLILSVNAIALPLTGMEHSIHVLGAVLVIKGAASLALGISKGAIPIMVTGIFICSTIRFEGLALALTAITALAIMGHRRIALATLTGISAIITIYGLIMYSLGLPLLPSSVLTKSELALSASDNSITRVFRSLAASLYHSLENRWGILIALAFVFLFRNYFLLIDMNVSVEL